MRGPQADTPRGLNETSFQIGALVAPRRQTSLYSFRALYHLPGKHPAGAYYFFGTSPWLERVGHFELLPRVQFSRLGRKYIFLVELFLLRGQLLFRNAVAFIRCLGGCNNIQFFYPRGSMDCLETIASLLPTIDHVVLGSPYSSQSSDEHQLVGNVYPHDGLQHPDHRIPLGPSKSGSFSMITPANDPPHPSYVGACAVWLWNLSEQSHAAYANHEVRDAIVPRIQAARRAEPESESE